MSEESSQVGAEQERDCSRQVVPVSLLPWLVPCLAGGGAETGRSMWAARCGSDLILCCFGRLGVLANSIWPGLKHSEGTVPVRA